MSKKNQFYLGPNKIVDTKTVDGKVQVTTEDDRVRTMNQKLYDVSVTDKPIDLTSLRELQMEPMLKEILATILEWDMPLEHWDFVTSKLTMSLNDSITRATEKLFGNKLEDRTAGQIDEILKQD